VHLLPSYLSSFIHDDDCACWDAFPLQTLANPENSQARKKSSEADGVTRYG
jgi:hypothetical protein